VEARVLEVLPAEKKIRLTMKAAKADKSGTRAAAKAGRQEQGGGAGASDFGQLLREKIEDKDRPEEDENKS